MINNSFCFTNDIENATVAFAKFRCGVAPIRLETGRYWRAARRAARRTENSKAIIINYFARQA